MTTLLELFDQLTEMKQPQLVRYQLNIHKRLTEILLCGKSSNTSKGKSMAPGRKLEKNLKHSIRNFQLEVDMMPFYEEDSSCHIDFKAWFRTSVFEPYGDKISSTIQFLCKALQIDDPWIYKQLSLMRQKHKGADIEMESDSKSVQSKSSRKRVSAQMDEASL